MVCQLDLAEPMHRGVIRRWAPDAREDVKSGGTIAAVARYPRRGRRPVCAHAAAPRRANDSLTD
jgi:hypothetical protein